MAFFEGLVVSEGGESVYATSVGGSWFYVIDDHGFLRHIEARRIDRAVLEQFMAQIEGHQDEAAAAMLKLMGSDDLFTKAMVDSTLQHLNLEQVLDHKLPEDARQWLGMMGFRVVIDLHGDLVRVDMPAAPEEYGDES